MDAFASAYEEHGKLAATGEATMVGYRLDKTVSENGSVTRGVCHEENGKLTDNVRRCEMGNGHDEALKHFTAIVLDGAEKDYVPVQGVNMIKILEAMYKSAETGKEVIL